MFADTAVDDAVPSILTQIAPSMIKLLCCQIAIPCFAR